MSKKDVKKTPQAKSEITSPPSQPVQQPELKIEENTILATGIEDYGRWKGMFQDQKREGKPPFPRRGRIWA